MAQRKFIFVNSDGDYEESNPATDDIALNSIALGGATLPLPAGVAIDTNGDQIDMGGATIIDVGYPVNNTDAANKQFVLDSLTGLDFKNSVRAATTTTDGNITFSGSAPDMVDGINVKFLGARILVKNQTLPEENGIYQVSVVGGGTDDNTWIRATDADTVAEFNANAYAFVEQGTTYADTGWVVTSHITTLGTDAVNWAQFSGQGSFTASFGIEIVGSDIRADLLGGSGGSGGLSIVGVDEELSINFAVSPYNQANRPIAADKLASTSAGEGASIIGIQDAGGYFTSTNVEGALQEIGASLVGSNASVTYFTTDGTGVTIGDVVYVSALPKIVSTMPVNALHRPVGVAASTVGPNLPVLVIQEGFLTGVIAGGTADQQWFWNGTAWSTTAPTASGSYVWKVGETATATIGYVDLDFVKKNS